MACRYLFLISLMKNAEEQRREFYPFLKKPYLFLPFLEDTKFRVQEYVSAQWSGISWSLYVFAAACLLMTTTGRACVWNS